MAGTVPELPCMYCTLRDKVDQNSDKKEKAWPLESLFLDVSMVCHDPPNGSIDGSSSCLTMF